MQFRIAVLPGDGVGPEVTTEAVRVLRAVADLGGYDFAFATGAVGGAGVVADGSPLPRATLDRCLESDAVLLGAVGGPEFDALPPEQRPETGLLALRRALGGFANLRPVRCHAPVIDCSPLRPQVVLGADILFVRELLGGIYFAEPRGFEESAAFNTMRYSVEEIERVAHVAFRQAQRRRRQVTSVDKANVLETSRLWRDVATRVARDYPDVKLEHSYVDSCAMRIITQPSAFDVILTENLFGDVLSDEAAVIAGSLGMLASATLGGDVDLYEPVHGSAPDIAGRNAANPIGAIASAAMLLRHTAHLDEEACAVESAIENVLKAGYRTPDLQHGAAGQRVTTSAMGAAIERSVGDCLDRQRAYHAV